MFPIGLSVVFQMVHQHGLILGGLVYMGNDHALEIASIDSIKVNMGDDVVHTILEVQHVKGLKKNLLLMGQLDDLGSEFHTKNGLVKIVKGMLVVMKVEKIVPNLCMLHGMTNQETKMFVANFKEELIMIWHRKLGHMLEKGLKIFFHQKFLLKLKTIIYHFVSTM